MKYFKIKYCLAAAAFLAAVVYFGWSLSGEKYSNVEVGGNKFKIKLVEFSEPVRVGIGSPNLPEKHGFYLKAFSVINNPRDYSYEEACRFASKAKKDAVSKERYNFIRESIDEKSMVFFQATVDYVVDVVIVATGDRYLAVGYRSGYKDGVGDVDEHRAVTSLIWEDDQWKACGQGNGFGLISENIPLTSLRSLREMVSKRG
jgi:hypothetical protein